MGTNAVGAMIVAGPEGFVKNQYRKFNIRSADLTPGDDFAMMREVLTRRFKRLLKEHGLPAGESVPVSEEGSHPLTLSLPRASSPLRTRHPPPSAADADGRGNDAARLKPNSLFLRVRGAA